MRVIRFKFAAHRPGGEPAGAYRYTHMRWTSVVLRGAAARLPGMNIPDLKVWSAWDDRPPRGTGLPVVVSRRPATLDRGSYDTIRLLGDPDVPQPPVGWTVTYTSHDVPDPDWRTFR